MFFNQILTSYCSSNVSKCKLKVDVLSMCNSFYAFYQLCDFKIGYVKVLKVAL